MHCASVWMNCLRLAGKLREGDFRREIAGTECRQLEEDEVFVLCLQYKCVCILIIVFLAAV
jgi:hypothetical protein